MVRKLPSGEFPKLVALSAGGNDKELSTHGVGIEHIEELMVRMTMRLLHSCCRLSFGGTLGVPKQKLTELLVQAAQAWLGEDMAAMTDVNQPDTWPLVNYSAWPNYRAVTTAMRANLVGICQFKDVNPPDVSPQRLAELSSQTTGEQSDPEVKMLTASALSAMRRLSAQESSLRIVWGGKITGPAGWMPGILEEVACSLRENKPVLVLGGLGGCAHLIAEYLLSVKPEWPAAFPDEATIAIDKLPGWLPADVERLRSNIADAKKYLKGYHDQIHGRDPIHGTPTELLVEALTCQSANRSIEIALTVAQTIK